MLTAALLLIAATPQPAPVYALEWTIDVPLVVVPAMISIAWPLVAETGPAHCAPLCDRDDVLGFDRGAAGNYSESWGLVSDVALLSTLSLGSALVLVDEGLSFGLNDLVVGIEVLALTSATAAIVNLATRRPRPLLYSTEAPLDSRNDPRAQLSFFSGHAALTAAMSSYLFTTTYRKDSQRALPWIVLGAGTIATSVAAVGRVQAGRHFPTDVIVGAAIGASYGLLLPALRAQPVRIVPAVSSEYAGASATLSF